MQNYGSRERESVLNPRNIFGILVQQLEFGINQVQFDSINSDQMVRNFKILGHLPVPCTIAKGFPCVYVGKTSAVFFLIFLWMLLQIIEEYFSKCLSCKKKKKVSWPRKKRKFPLQSTLENLMGQRSIFLISFIFSKFKYFFFCLLTYMFNNLWQERNPKHINAIKQVA